MFYLISTKQTVEFYNLTYYITQKRIESHIFMLFHLQIAQNNFNLSDSNLDVQSVTLYDASHTLFLIIALTG